MMGAFAAVFFLVLLAADVLFGLFFVCYAGNCFLAAVQDTAAGNDEVAWPDEPVQDWLVRGLHVVGILLVGFIPAGIVRGILISQRIEGDFLMAETAGAAVLNWLLFPIVLLSSLSGSSRLFFVRWAVLRQLLRIPVAVFVLYFVSGMLIAGWLVLVYFMFMRTLWPLLPAAAAVGSLSLLLYARLMGRVAWVLGELTPVKRKAAEKLKEIRGMKIEAHDPWAAPVEQREMPAETAPAPGAVYGLVDDPVPRQLTETPLDGYPAIGEETFEVQEPPEPPTDEDAGIAGRSVSLADKQEEKLTFVSEQPPAPAHPLLDGVYTFPWYASNRKVAVLLFLGLTVMGAIALWIQVPE